MAVSKEQIWAAADQLAAEGQRPTLEAVRQITGGSFTTISPALNEWKAKQASASTPLREAAPQAVTDRLVEVGTEIWAVALELANARLTTEREALEKARTELEADRAEATELADRLADEVEGLKVRLVAVEEAESAARNEAEELRDQLAAAQEQAHTADARTQEIERRAADLRTELDRAHQDADRARQALTEQQQAAKATADQLDQVRAQLAKAEARSESTEAQAAELRTRLADQEQAAQEQRKEAAAEAHRMAERMTAAQAERDQARQEAGKAREEAARLAGQLQAHQEQAAALLARINPAESKPAGTRKKGGE